MAYGLQGEIENRMDAFRGNPQQLQQRYAAKQELLDLLALQKLKSEKEAAARDMQLKMAQQQAAQGQPPTIKDQREQEVMSMTKQELAQQVGGLARQKQAMDQRRIQQMLGSGLATAPAPNVARMAGGGIVAFAEGDLVEDRVPPRPRPKLPGDPSVYAWDRKYGETHNPDGTPKGAQPAAPQFTKDPMTGRYESAEEMREKQILRGELVDVPGRGFVPREEAEALEAYRQSVEPIPPSFGVTEKPPVAPPTPTSAPAPGGLAALPGAAGQQPPSPVPAAPSPRPPMAGAGIQQALTDPFAQQKAEEQRVAGLLGLTPAQRATYDKGAKDIEALYREEMDPEAQRERKLSAFLRGAGGRSSFGSVMAGGSGAAEAERQRNLAQRLKGTEAFQKKLEDVIGIERAAVEKGIGAGQRAAEVGATMRGFEMRSKDVDKQLESAGLDRESRERIAKISAQVQGDVAKANRELQGEMRTQTQLRLLTEGRQRAITTATKPIDTQIAQLESLQIMGGKLDKAQQEQLSNLRARRDLIVSNIEEQYDDLMGSIMPGSGFKVVGVKPSGSQ